ncbi:MAG: MaoC family dehydratase N-terminal domain-containing protein [Actinobacteria bacterium]|nr:MaoC family dehydratase N-terminal domain-containing protein [Actinomycetota bacterium]MBU1944973.1 MaoC family dehydratase N-terminal domain-containing protein [Actinomycetota bacterium]MBU2688454.1 MaoC family dehydratase N-terminal domain-containing protein [Actinomycetota bacterium]
MVNESIVGKEFPPFEFLVERGKIKEFARALGDRNPIYTDIEVARRVGFEAVPAPPTYTASFMHQVPDENFLLNLMAEMEIDVARSVHGESEYEYIRPIEAGDVLTVTMTVKDIQKKEGRRGGAMTLITTEATYANQDGEVVQKDRMVFIERASVA